MNSFPEPLSFLTFATGRKYLEMAFTLARSYRFHDRSGIPFHIASTEDIRLPRDLRWVKKILVAPDKVGNGLEFKLHLLEIAPSERAIFLDADSVVYGDISALFDRFDATRTSVIGTKVTNGEWVDEDVQAACREFGLDYLIRYCGALYHLVNNQEGRQIFDQAMTLYCSGRVFQRNDKTMYDEPIMGIAMSKCRVEPLTDDGNTWGDLVHYDPDDQLNVFNGPARFLNIRGTRTYKFWLPEGPYQPTILHVGGGNHNKKPWLFDTIRLKLYYKLHLPVTISDTIVRAAVIPVYEFARFVKRRWRKRR